MKTNLTARILLLSCLISASFHCGRQPGPIPLPEGAKLGEVTRTTDSIRSGQKSFRVTRGVMVVPENRKKSDSRPIALPYIRIHSSHPAPAEPVFFLGGGPGQPNIYNEISAWTEDLLARRDFIMIGYRGVEGSVVLNCPEVEKAMRGAGDDLLGDESLRALAKAMASDAKRLQESGVDLSGYTIEQVADDIETARSAFGFEKIDLLSMSYGTRVAQIYSYLYPDRLARSVMVGVNPPGHFTFEPTEIDSQLFCYSKLWAADSAAAKRTGNLAETMRRISHNMPRRWLLFPIDPGKVKFVTFALLFQTGTAAKVFDAYVAADQGDPSGLALMSLAYDFMVPGISTWGEFFAKGVTDYDSTRDYSEDLDPPGSILGSPMSQMTWGAASIPGSWPIVLLPDSLRHVRDSDTETLLISGSVDFSTPAVFAERELLPHLRRGRQIVLSEMGHCGDLMGLQPAAFSRLLTSFYDTGRADTSPIKYQPANFKAGFGFPAIAKAVLVAIAVLFAIFAAVVWLVARWYRRRRARLSAATVRPEG